MTALDYVVGVNSDAMRYAKDVVPRSVELARQIGTVERVELGKFWGFKRRSGFSETHFALSLHVSGSTGNTKVALQLVEQGGTWRVVSSSVPL
jgi:hypothetical protein